jgi:hypothetical protein
MGRYTVAKTGSFTACWSTSGTIPTIVARGALGSSGCARRIRRPKTCPPSAISAAIVELTTMTGGAASSSAAISPRPSRIGMPNAEKSLGEIAAKSVTGGLRPGSTPCPSAA